MRSCHSDRIKLRAEIQDDSGILILGLILLAIFFCFSAIFGLLSEAKVGSSDSKMLFVGLAGATIFISWMVMQVAFALHYAHQYYRPDHAIPGINAGRASRLLGLLLLLDLDRGSLANFRCQHHLEGVAAPRNFA
jgi:uncharacterized membrane protein